MIAILSGNALCIEEKTARKWRDQVLNAQKPPQLEDLTGTKSSRLGRPNKTEAIAQAYLLHYPDGHTVTMKEVIKVLEKEMGMSFCVKTLRRAISTRADAMEKTPD